MSTPIFQGRNAIIATTIGLMIAGVAIVLVIAQNFKDRNHSKFEVSGVSVICETNTEEWCPTPEEFSEFLLEITSPFEAHLENPVGVLEGIEYRVVSSPLRYPGASVECPAIEPPYDDESHRVDGIPCLAWGLSWPTERYSKVFGPYALSPGTGGHEIRLHLMQSLFPGQNEPADILWMQSNGIYD